MQDEIYLKLTRAADKERFLNLKEDLSRKALGVKIGNPAVLSMALDALQEKIDRAAG